MDFVLIDKYIGLYMKDQREKRHLTIQEVADELQISKPTYYNYESARRSMPMNIFKELCRIYNVDYIQVLKDAQKYMISNISSVK